MNDQGGWDKPTASATPGGYFTVYMGFAYTVSDGRYGRSGGRSGRFKSKREERGRCKTGERHQIIPRQSFLQVREGKYNEHDDRNNLLNDLELESREMAVAEAICRHRQAVFEQRNGP